VAERLNVAADASLANLQATYVVVARLVEIDVDVAEPVSTWLINKQNTNAGTLAIWVAPTFQGFYRREGAEGTAVPMTNAAHPDQSVDMHILRVGLTSAKYQVASSAGGLKTVDADTFASSGVDDDNNGILAIGNHPTANNFHNVARIIYDVVAYNKLLSDGEVGQLVDWFGIRYNSEWVKQGQLFGATSYYSARSSSTARRPI